jgi:nitrite reductase (NADH) small subunit
MTVTESEMTIAPLAAIPPGEGRTFEIAGQRIAVFRTRAGQVFATQAECPHKGGPLADGLVGGATVICPLHSWKFDLGTGKTQADSCQLKTYPVTVDEKGRIVLTIPASR